MRPRTSVRQPDQPRSQRHQAALEPELANGSRAGEWGQPPDAGLHLVHTLRQGSKGRVVSGWFTFSVLRLRSSLTYAGPPLPDGRGSSRPLIHVAPNVPPFSPSKPDTGWKLLEPQGSEEGDAAIEAPVGGNDAPTGWASRSPETAGFPDHPRCDCASQVLPEAWRLRRLRRNEVRRPLLVQPPIE
jgi:hypothetical protein